MLFPRPKLQKTFSGILCIVLTHARKGQVYECSLRMSGKFIKSGLLYFWTLTILFYTSLHFFRYKIQLLNKYF